MGYTPPSLEYLIENTASLMKEFVQKAGKYISPSYKVLYENLEKLENAYSLAAASDKKNRSHTAMVQALAKLRGLLHEPAKIEEVAKKRGVSPAVLETQCRDILLGAMFDRFFRLCSEFDNWNRLYVFWKPDNSILYSSLRQYLLIGAEEITPNTVKDYFTRHSYVIESYLKAYRQYLDQPHEEGFVWQSIPHIATQKTEYFAKLNKYIADAEGLNARFKRQEPFIYFILSMNDFLSESREKFFKQLAELDKDYKALGDNPINELTAKLAWAKARLPQEWSSIFAYCAERFEQDCERNQYKFNNDAECWSTFLGYLRYRYKGLQTHSLLGTYIFCLEESKQCGEQYKDQKRMKENVLEYYLHKAIHPGTELIDAKSACDIIEIFLNFKNKLGAAFTPDLKNTPWEKLGMEALSTKLNELLETYKRQLQGERMPDQRFVMV
ncbi:hypothetical protein Lbir_1144 [Legionella birminghamensis]|uniref:Dot/Icm secretion system substrate n=1 Tax=Legionella birminghamensis TaxID=28083 RepID=A0A378ICN6_9GAMM|nr:hypothetical protein [Legionella birminghamensis]KTC73092.1 hypothetical protein Lbir_1144 [Legionella birminghamensis]STX32331.1 Uncharacterised protein [Legionella birminghamensis]